MKREDSCLKSQHQRLEKRKLDEREHGNSNPVIIIGKIEKNIDYWDKEWESYENKESTG